MEEFPGRGSPNMGLKRGSHTQDTAQAGHWGSEGAHRPPPRAHTWVHHCLGTGAGPCTHRPVPHLLSPSGPGSPAVYQHVELTFNSTTEIENKTREKKNKKPRTQQKEKGRLPEAGAGPKAQPQCRPQTPARAPVLAGQTATPLRVSVRTAPCEHC